jgi:hypothetical protein
VSLREDAMDVELFLIQLCGALFPNQEFLRMVIDRFELDKFFIAGIEVKRQVLVIAIHV